MAGLKTTLEGHDVVSRTELQRHVEEASAASSMPAADKAVEVARRDRVMAAADRVMRKHRATFAALAK